MRIAVNTRVLIKDKLEGVGWYIYEIVSRLVRTHPEHTFILIFDRPYHPDFVFGPNVIPVVTRPPARHPVLFAIWFECRLPHILKKYKADVFYSPDGFLSLRSRLPTLLTVHDLAFKHFPGQNTFIQRSYYQFFMPRFLLHARHIIAVSESTRLDILDSGIAPDKVTVAFNGANERFKPVELSSCQMLRDTFTEGQPYFLYVGAIHPRKNMIRLIRAFTQFKQDTTLPHKLVLLGRMAWMSDDVKKAMANSPAAADIIHVGYQAESLPTFYSAATALVYVSLFEGFGIPILEAMCCDTAVITSNISSMPEVAGSAALLVDPYSESQISHAMQQIAQDPALRISLIDAGKKQRQMFSWDHAAGLVWNQLNALSPLQP
jgi:glycosyltransferase involved in cell wall biosynthesis